MTSVGESDLRTSKRYALAQSLLLIVFAVVVFIAPKDYLFRSAVVSIAGNILGGMGALLILFAAVTLRRVIQVAPEPKAGGELIQDGVYKYLRHPIYTGIMSCVIGLFLRTPTIWIGIASFAVIVFLFFKARLEEKLLLSAYPGYADYRRRTWGLFPGVR